MVMIFFIASRALGLARDMVISHQFGTSRELDAYFAAFNVPDFIFNVIAGGALGSAFIPTFSAALATGDARRAWRLARAITTLTGIAMTALAALFAVFAQPLVAATVAQGFAPAEQRLTADLMRWMLVTPIVFGVSGIVMGILNSHQHFLLPALAPVMYNAAIIAGAVWLTPMLGVAGLVIGVIAGSFLHLLVQLPWFYRFRSQSADAQLWDFDLQSPDVREVIRLMLPRAFGIAAVQINFLVNTILASALPSGAIAALSYAWRVMLLPEGVVGQSLATAVFPTFSTQTARRELAEFRDTFSTTLRTTLFLTIPASVGLIALGAPYIALLFQRGEFDAESTRQTTWALQFFALALCAHSSLEILARAFYALHDTFTPVIVGVAAMALNIGLSVALIAPLAHGGLALANSLATILETITLIILLRRRIGDIDARRIALSTARMIVAATAMGAALLAFANAFAGAPPLSVAGFGTLIGATIYFATAFALRAEEIGFVLRRFQRHAKKS